MSELLVSVIIQTFNHEKYISQAIEGVLAQQTDFPYEVIIAEDCSTDKTREIVFAYQCRFPETIRVITSQQNVGARQNSVRAINAAKGKYIAYCEGDDYWRDPLKLKKQVAVMKSDELITMCFHAVMYEYEIASKKNKIVHYNRGNRYFSIEDVIVDGGRFYKTVTAMIKRSIFKNMPEWYIQSPVGDVAMSLLAAINGRIYYFDEAMAVYRVGVPGSWTQRSSANPEFIIRNIEELSIMRNKFDEYTNYSYHKYILRRNRMTIKVMLLGGNLPTKEFKQLLDFYYDELAIPDRFVLSAVAALHTYWYQYKNRGSCRLSAKP